MTRVLPEPTRSRKSQQLEEAGRVDKAGGSERKPGSTRTASGTDDRELIRRKLAGLTDELTGQTYGDYLRQVTTGGAGGGQVSISLDWPYPAAGLVEEITERVHSVLDRQVQVDVSFGLPAVQETPLPHVAHPVAVASGKGGVGKSTVAVNLALALAAEGARVGLLDADIYGPSIGLMLGVAEGQRPAIKDGQMLPVEGHGLPCMSMAFVTSRQTPAIWRGPMASGALQQLLNQTLWPELDLLLIDLPPGTGDIQLTLAQQVALSGAVIVTTPQQIALLDVVRSVEMFRKVEVPVLGIVENMSTYRCGHCGRIEHPFGEGGGRRLAEDYRVPLLGALPMDMSIRESCDLGLPVVLREPRAEAALVFRRLARSLGAELYLSRKSGLQVPTISVADD